MPAPSPSPAPAAPYATSAQPSAGSSPGPCRWTQAASASAAPTAAPATSPPAPRRRARVSSPASLWRRQERVALHIGRDGHAEEGERRRGQVDDGRIGGREAARGEDDTRRVHHVGGGMIAAPLLQVGLE